jgi:tRNA (adenine57-N1/adenine58-N1)-methyltransferase
MGEATRMHARSADPGSILPHEDAGDADAREGAALDERSVLLRDGDSILLVDRRGRRYLKRLKSGHRLTIRSSVLACDRLIGLPEGSRVGGDRDEEFRVFRPTYAELVPLIERSAEPVFAKDAGLIVTRGDIRPGQTVIEIGVGAGALSMALLRAVGPTGRLVTYEIREEFAVEARRNVERYEGPSLPWTIHIGDASAGIAERDVDRVIIDVPDAVSVLGASADAVRDGGILVAFSPTVLQVRDIHDAAHSSAALGFAETFEVLERKWHVDAASVRPDHRMVAHTGFITVIRRLAR